MNATALVITAVVLVVIVAAAWFAVRAVNARRSGQLRESFGPEYERALSDAGGERRRAEADLESRRERRRQLDIRPLSEDSRRRHVLAWEQIQASFVDMPQQALTDADELVSQVLGERGYPLEGFESQAADVSVDHPAAVDSYRYAHDMLIRGRQQDATTEEMRLAMQRYRSLIDELLAPQTPADETVARPAPGRPEMG